MSFCSDNFNDSNEMIVAANTRGVGQFRPILSRSEPGEKYIKAAAAYWCEMRKTNEPRQACKALIQSLRHFGILSPDHDDLSRALYLESPYRKKK